MPPRIHFVRHGETEWAISGKHTSRTEVPLTARGDSEARDVGERLREITFTHVFTSPRERALRTCQLAGLREDALIEPDLAEWDYGDYEGKRSAEIRLARPRWNIFQDGCPNGETPIQVAERADRLIERLRALTGNIVLFSHGQFGSILAARWIGLQVVTGQHFPLSTASISILSYDLRSPEIPVVDQWNSGPNIPLHDRNAPKLSRDEI